MESPRAVYAIEPAAFAVVEIMVKAVEANTTHKPIAVHRRMDRPRRVKICLSFFKVPSSRNNAEFKKSLLTDILCQFGQAADSRRLHREPHSISRRLLGQLRNFHAIAIGMRNNSSCKGGRLERNFEVALDGDGGGCGFESGRGTRRRAGLCQRCAQRRGVAYADCPDLPRSQDWPCQYAAFLPHVD